MLNIYKNKHDIPENSQLIMINDIFFNKHTVHQMDSKAAAIIRKIDGAVQKGHYQILSGLNSELLNIDKLSSGCKTALNIYYNPDKVFSLKECGDNALDVIYTLNTGNVYCEYPVISFEIISVLVHDANGQTQLDSYEELKGWWQDVQ